MRQSPCLLLLPSSGCSLQIQPTECSNAPQIVGAVLALVSGEAGGVRPVATFGFSRIDDLPAQTYHATGTASFQGTDNTPDISRRAGIRIQNKTDKVEVARGR